MRWAGAMVLVIQSDTFPILVPLLIAFYRSFGPLECCWYAPGCPDDGPDHHEWSVRAFTYASHSVLDALSPVGIMHAYMNSQEVEMEKLAVN